MLYVLLALLCYSVIPLPEAAVRQCEPSNYICSGRCPDVPDGLVLPKDVLVCMKDSTTGACVCWLMQSQSSQLDSMFLCEARTNGSASRILCKPPSHCFPPDAKPSCLVIKFCDCIQFLDAGSMKFGVWKPVLAEIRTMERSAGRDDDQDSHVEKYPGDVREFSLKHLLFLLGFVIAPLLCWCLLNFLHEGKCRKKRPQPPEALPIPTSRSVTIDDMNNDGDQTNHRAPTLPTAPYARPSSPLSAYDPHNVVQVEVCPGQDLDTRIKCDSPPPYDETQSDCNFSPEDCGPPPTYEDAMQGTDTNIQQIWQTVFIVHSGPRENA